MHDGRDIMPTQHLAHQPGIPAIADKQSRVRRNRVRKTHVGFYPDDITVARAIAPYSRRHVLYHRLYKLRILRY